MIKREGNKLIIAADENEIGFRTVVARDKVADLLPEMHEVSLQLNRAGDNLIKMMMEHAREVQALLADQPKWYQFGKYISWCIRCRQAHKHVTKLIEHWDNRWKQRGGNIQKQKDNRHGTAWLQLWRKGAEG